jgi:hypothetical protein
MMKIKVTRRHIFEGVQGSWDSCPIALALRDELGVTNLEVGNGVIRCGKKKFKMSNSADTFVGKFDEGEPVKPFTFELK